MFVVQAFSCPIKKSNTNWEFLAAYSICYLRVSFSSTMTPRNFTLLALLMLALLIVICGASFIGRFEYNWKHVLDTRILSRQLSNGFWQNGFPQKKTSELRKLARCFRLRRIPLVETRRITYVGIWRPLKVKWYSWRKGHWRPPLNVFLCRS